MLKILVDFNTINQDERRRVRINLEQFPYLSGELHPGIRVLLHEPDLEVEAILEVELDQHGKEWWFGVPDWSTSRDLPDPS